MDIVYVDHALSDKERADILFSGNIIIYKNVPAMSQVIAYADKLLGEKLRGIPPEDVQHHLSPEEFLHLTGEAQTIFRKDESVRGLFFDALRQCGVCLNSTFYDHFPMRIVPFGSTHGGAQTAGLGHHRDTWGSNIHNQLNWWAPLYSLTAERSIALYPKYWSEPVTNNTDTWSFEKFIEERKNTPAERKCQYLSAPSPIESIDENSAFNVVLQPGEVLNFASAHLHASVSNTTDKTRFSVEMRTVAMSDLQEQRQAPNVDNAGQGEMYQWFKNISSKQSLAAALQ